MMDMPIDQSPGTTPDDADPQPVHSVTSTFTPANVNTLGLPARGLDAIALLAGDAHTIASKDKIINGWQFGGEFDANSRLDPSLLPYVELSDEQKKPLIDAATRTVKLLTRDGFIPYY